MAEPGNCVPEKRKSWTLGEEGLLIPFSRMWALVPDLSLNLLLPGTFSKSVSSLSLSPLTTRERSSTSPSLSPSLPKPTARLTIHESG